MNFNEQSFQDFLKLDSEAKREWYRWAIRTSARNLELEREIEICKRAIEGQTRVQAKEKGRGKGNQ